MTDKDLKPKPGRPRDALQSRLPSLRQQVLLHAGKAGMRGRWSKSHIKSSQLSRGMGIGLMARGGIVAPGSRRVIVRARYTSIVAGDLGAARAHLNYIQRDGVTREGHPGQLYDANSDLAEAAGFLDRSVGDPHQFRFIVSAEDSARLGDLKPFVRDLMAQMERDLGTKLDWVAVDHFNTGHPHSHIVIRGKDDRGKDLVMARDYIGYGVRARAQGLITFQLGPETQIERLQKLRAEMDQERLTSLDRSILAKSTNGFLVLDADQTQPARATLRIGRLRTLQRLGLAEERRPGVWQLDGKAELKLRQLGERADKFKMMQRALREAGIDRAAAALALFEKAPRKTPLIGKVIGVGMVDEITDRTWVVIDAVDGHVHYAELGRLTADVVPKRGMLVALAGGNALERPSRVPKLHVLSRVAVERLSAYEGPTWLDQAMASGWKPDASLPGISAELRSAFTARQQWLGNRQLGPLTDELVVTPPLLAKLRTMETERLAASLSTDLKATFVRRLPGERVHGIYDHAIETPTGRLAVIRDQDTFTLAPWKPALEPMRGLQVSGSISPNRAVWSLDRGRSLPQRGT